MMLPPGTDPSQVRIFSGVQPTGCLHLGNYLGAVRHFVELQNLGCEALFCIVDLHAITVFQEPKLLRQATRELAATFLACGLDPAKAILFNQSQVPAHAELGWIFNCVARIGWLSRMTQFKDKAGKDKERASVGLYDYPVLQAADILAYRATHVPIGEDQKQHLELCRDIAQKFNTDFAVPNFFPMTEALIPTSSARVMSLRDGLSKMSKSDVSDFSRINLTDDADALALKVKKAKTDPHPLPDCVQGFEGRPEAKNLLEIYAALADVSVTDSLQRFGGVSFTVFKTELTEVLIEKLVPMGQLVINYLQDTASIDQILLDGSQRADAIARPILAQVHEVLGFITRDHR